MQSISNVDDDQDIQERVEQSILYYPYGTPDKIKLVAANYYYLLKLDLEEKLNKDLLILQEEYSKKAKDIQTDINQIVNGSRQLTEIELSEIDEYLNEEEKQNKAVINSQLTNEELTGYWFNALKNCPMIKNEIKEKDENVLKHLKGIKYDHLKGIKYDHENKESKTNQIILKFIFEENDYFKTESSHIELTKTFNLNDEDLPLSTVGSVIHWVEGKNITKKTVKKKQSNKKSQKTRVISKEVDDQSFFNFFNSQEENNGKAQLTIEETARLEENISIHFDIARVIIDELLPYSLEYYLQVRSQEQVLQIQSEEEEAYQPSQIKLNSQSKNKAEDNNACKVQ